MRAMQALALIANFPFTAWAMDNVHIENNAVFNTTGAMQAAALGAIVAHSNFQFQPVETASIGGNRVNNAFNGGTGVVSVVQNSGQGAVTQSSVNVIIGGMAVPATSSQ